MRKGLLAAGVAAVAVLAAAGCSSSGSSNASGGGSSPVVLRLGFLANITHAPALVGLEKGYFTKQPGQERHPEDDGLQLRHRGDHRDPGGPARRGLRGAQPGDQRLAEVQRHRHQDHFRCGLRRRVTGGQDAASPRAAQLKGKSLATPSLGNTQDVALRYWLKQQGLTTPDRRRRRRHQADQAELGRGAAVQVRPDRRRLGAGALRARDGARGRASGW